MGGGVLTLTAANTYTGPTSVGEGTLALNSTASLASSIINVAGGATFDVSAKSGGFVVPSGNILEGSGRIAGNLTVNGKHKPGKSAAMEMPPGNGTIGIETVQGNYTLTGELDIDVAGTVAGTGYDEVLPSGTGVYNVSLSGTLGLGFPRSNDALPKALEEEIIFERKMQLPLAGV